jgi:Dolichyl-phosphate-mannose-protein mannosyltransferase
VAGLPGYGGSVAVNVRTRRSRARARPTRTPVLELWREWPIEAWGAIGVTLLFLALSCWWVVVDHSIPISDAGFHLQVTIEVFKDLQAGDWSAAVAPHLQYPPLVYLVGAFGDYVGGLGVPSMVIAENLFFVPLLALGCYHIGRLAFTPLAGLLAVVFALGSPLVARLFHLTMLDAPQAAMAAVSIWLILDTRYFTRLRWCAAAGVAVGLGMLTKEPLALFVAGPLAVTFVRGGWRSWKGIAVFALAVLVVAGPWYIGDFTQVRAISSAVSVSSTPSAANPLAPPRFSSQNLQWYMWSFLDTQIYLPLFLFALVGWVWTLVGFVRRRWVSPLAPELAIGAFVAWFALTETFVHDNRYGMSMLVYFAVFGSFWIVRLPRGWRIAAMAALVVVALANTLSSTFGTGGNVTITLPSALQVKAEPNFLTIYSNEGYLVSTAPHRGDDMVATLKALKARGVEGIVVLPTEAPVEAAFLEGLQPLAVIAGLPIGEVSSVNGLSTSVAVFDREALAANKARPCIEMSDGTGIWIRLGNPYAPGAQDFCPAFNPQFYK